MLINLNNNFDKVKYEIEEGLKLFKEYQKNNKIDEDDHPEIQISFYLPGKAFMDISLEFIPGNKNLKLSKISIDLAKNFYSFIGQRGFIKKCLNYFPLILDLAANYFELDSEIEISTYAQKSYISGYTGKYYWPVAFAKYFKKENFNKVQDIIITITHGEAILPYWSNNFYLKDELSKKVKNYKEINKIFQYTKLFKAYPINLLSFFSFKNYADIYLKDYNLLKSYNDQFLNKILRKHNKRKKLSNANEFGETEENRYAYFLAFIALLSIYNFKACRILDDCVPVIEIKNAIASKLKEAGKYIPLYKTVAEHLESKEIIETCFNYLKTIYSLKKEELKNHLKRNKNDLLISDRALLHLVLYDFAEVVDDIKEIYKIKEGYINYLRNIVNELKNLEQEIDIMFSNKDYKFFLDHLNTLMAVYIDKATFTDDLKIKAQLILG